MAESNTPFIDKNTAVDAFDESNKWLRPYFEPIDEFERIARNKPSSKIPDGLPRITDGTMAAIIQEDPKRVIQTNPTGLVTCKDYPEYAKMADIVLRDELIPYYNRMGNMLQKSWNMVGKSKTWGRSTSYTFLTNTNGRIHTDFVIPYVKDIITEKGKVFTPDSNVRFMRSWYQKTDLKSILRQESKREKEEKGYKSEWDLKLLQKFIDSGTTAKPANLQTPAETEKGGDTGGYEVIHAFQNGLNAEFYSFNPRFEKGAALRVKVTADPRGQMPFDDLYNNIDLSNPLGRGQVELSGGVQNLIDQQMQMFQFQSTMEMAPPLKVFGNVDYRKLPLRPNAIWKMGSQASGNDVVPYAVSNFALANFNTNYGLLKSTILGFNSSQDHSVGSDAGSPQQSKTQAGVQAQESRLGVSDNYTRKQYEDWFEKQSETSLNIYFSEKKGTATISVDKEDLNEIKKTKAAKYLTKDSQLQVPYKDIKDVVFKFQVNPDSSEVKEDSENVDKLVQTLELAQKVAAPEVQQKIPGLFKLIVKQIGAEGVDELFPEDQTDSNGQQVNGQAGMPGQPQQPAGPDPQQLMQMVQQMVEQAMQHAEQAKAQQPKTIAESLNIKFADLPEDAKQQVLAQIGIQSNMATPQHAQQQADLVLKADKQAHDTNMALANHQHTVQQADVQNQQQAQQQQQAAMQTQQPGQPNNQETPQEQSQDPAGADGPLSPEEQQVAHALLQRGFNDNDIEQAVVMLRQGAPLEQVISTIGAKHA